MSVTAPLVYAMIYQAVVVLGIGATAVVIRVSRRRNMEFLDWWVLGVVVLMVVYMAIVTVFQIRKTRRDREEVRRYLEGEEED